MLRFFFFISSLQLLTTCQSFQSIKPWQVPDLKESHQALVVSAETDTSTNAILERYEKGDKGWTKIGDSVLVLLGRNGLAWGIGKHSLQDGQQKKEGDGKSPAGIFSLKAIFGTTPSDTTHFRMPYLHISEVVECVDDVNSKFYNQLVNNTFVEKDWNSSEQMLNVGPPYKWGVLVDHNPDNQPGNGSCIFLHIWKAPSIPTAGCTSMREEDLISILNWLDGTKKPVLVQAVNAVFSQDN